MGTDKPESLDEAMAAELAGVPEELLDQQDADGGAAAELALLREQLEGAKQDVLYAGWKRILPTPELMR
jgi:molecular chaperone GrpE